jgi:hypothetical protein
MIRQPSLDVLRALSKFKSIDINGYSCIVNWIRESAIASAITSMATDNANQIMKASGETLGLLAVADILNAADELRKAHEQQEKSPGMEAFS